MFFLEAGLLILFLEGLNVSTSRDEIRSDRYPSSTVEMMVNGSAYADGSPYGSPFLGDAGILQRWSRIFSRSSSPNSRLATPTLQQENGTVLESVSEPNGSRAIAQNSQPIPTATPFQLTARSAFSFINSVGVNTHLHYYDTAYGNFSLIKQRLQELGVRHIRDGGSDPTWIQRTNELASVGIRSTIVVDPNIGVAPNASYTPAAPGYTINQMIKEKLPNAVAGVEVLNEFDFFHFGYSFNGQPLNSSTWSGYLRDFTRDVHAAMKSDPATQNIPIIGPSFVYPDSSTNIGMLEQWVDYGNLHPYNYPSFPGNGNLDQEIANRSKPFGNLPLIATEAGYHTGGAETGNAVSEAVHAKYIPRMFLNNFNKGIRRTFSYELIDQWPNPGDKESNFGLLRYDGSPKPAFTAQKNLMSLLNDSNAALTPKTLNYSITGNTTNLQQTLLQKSNGNLFLILWLEVPSTDQNRSRTITLNLNTPISQATTFLPNQSTAPTRQYNAPQQLTLTVPDHPLVVRLKPAP